MYFNNYFKPIFILIQCSYQSDNNIYSVQIFEQFVHGSEENRLWSTDGLYGGLVREISTDEIKTSPRYQPLTMNSENDKKKFEQVFPIRLCCVHTEIGREANLTDGTCPEQCHISIKYGFWISLCIFILQCTSLEN